MVRRRDGARTFRPLFVREEAWEKYRPKDFDDLVAAFRAEEAKQ